MSESAAPLAAIRQAPDDDAPRLIYADWLDEHGQPERAEFIRVQIELARNDSPELRKREAELLAEHHDRLAGEVASAGVRYVFERGFIIAVGHTGVYSAKLPTLRVEYTASIRFFPNHRVIYTTHPSNEADVPNRFRRDDQLRENQYILSAIALPFEIRFDYFESDREPVYAFHGAFLGSRLRLERREFGGYNEGVRVPLDFAHVPIDGLDSRQDSP